MRQIEANVNYGRRNCTRRILCSFGFVFLRFVCVLCWRENVPDNAREDQIGACGGELLGVELQNSQQHTKANKKGMKEARQEETIVLVVLVLVLVVVLLVAAALVVAEVVVVVVFLVVVVVVVMKRYGVHR